MRAKAGVIIPAAGIGTRMRSSIPKQFLDLAGTPLLVYSAKAFSECDFVAQVVVVVNTDWCDNTRQMLTRQLPETTKIKVVAGGPRRQDSVENGLDALDETIDVVMVHDGARPLITTGLIERCYKAIVEYGAAIAAVPVKDTLKRANVDQKVALTVDRDALWQAQTPQGARRDLLEAAFRRNGGADTTDEALLLERAGIPVHLVTGEEANLKITREGDYTLAESIMRCWSKSIRVGHGFDAHRFEDDRDLILGGVEIKNHRGLAGHSDADVVCHALCDAILGAIGCGDIGKHFPDNDPAYEDISSLVLLDRVMELCSSRGTVLTNADITIVCQAPKLSPYIEAMRSQLARHCQAELMRINIKATTTERMGYVGRQEGISCHAVVLVEHS